MFGGMIDTQHENLILVARAKLPGNPSIATRWRWIQRGVRGGVKLESIIIGGQRYTSAEAVARFIARLNAPGDVPAPTLPAAEAANARLAALGA